MIFKNAGYVVVVLVSALYVASSLINISKSGKSVYEIIATGVLSLIVGVMINGAFRSIGVRRGDEDERVIATNQLHAKTVEEITPYIERLDEFCEGENKRAVREIRTRILMREGMKYSDYFDENGASRLNSSAPHPPLTKCSGCHREAVAVPLPPLGKAEMREGMKYSDYFDESGAAKSPTLLKSELGAPGVRNAKCNEIATNVAVKSAEQMKSQGDEIPSQSEGMDKVKFKAYRRALRVKVKPLVSSNLTSDGVKANEPFDFGKSKREFTAQRSAGDVLVKLIMAVLFGYFGVSLASEVNVASVIWNGLQIVLYITGGVIQMYNSFMWVVDDYRGSVVKKIDYLQKFKRVVEIAEKSQS